MNEELINQHLKTVKYGQDYLNRVQEMQERWNQLAKAAAPPEHVLELAKRAEMVRKTIQSTIDAMETIRPMMEYQSRVLNNIGYEAIINLSKNMAATRAVFQASGIQSILDMANTINEQIQVSTAVRKDIVSALQALGQKQVEFNSFSELASHLEGITKEEQKAFEKLDHIKTEEDIVELEKIVEDNKDNQTINYLVFIYFIPIIIYLLTVGVSISSDSGVKSVGNINENTEMIESKEKYQGFDLNKFLLDRSLSLLDAVIAAAFIKGVTTSFSYLKKRPHSKSDTLARIDKGKELDIIGDERYYYKVRYYNEKGELTEGYVAKRNIIKPEDFDTNE